MVKFINIVVVILFILAGFSSTFAQSSNKLRKMAEQFEVNGMYEEAADYYYRSYIKKTKNIKSLIGLERTAPKMLEEELSALNKAFLNEEYLSFIERYESLKSQATKLDNVGVDLEISRSYSEKYKECRREMAQLHYDLGRDFFDEDDLDGAIAEFKLCLEYEEDYRDADLYLSEAIEAKAVEDAEQHYQLGLARLEQEEYREAYRAFDECLSIKKHYKDAEDLKEEALEMGKVRIGIFEFKNDTRYAGIHGPLYSYVVSNAVNYESPFIEVVDRQNLQSLLEEQKLGMSGIVDESSASKAGMILGLDYVVMGRVINVTKTGGKKEHEEVKAYELKYAKNSEGDKIPTGKPVTYNLYQASITVTYEAKFQVVSVETGQIVADKILSSSDSDHVKYATYEGDHSLLYKSDPGKDSYFMLGLRNNKVDQRLFKARKSLMKMDEMEAPIVKDLARKISDGICERYK